ncbi:hypothetical protein [Tenggerimyces flavus]|uniref:PKD domain-containing protein n=1 Tax=Tenggerimyces flavus TaxID=1708749 RepID=A0ABV7YP95_9ACTN|nr:hypothetical protein [Tenggerimyces flavus]MBM7785808.1 hypothetical protein [Tenggerimyces flavus]
MRLWRLLAGGAAIAVVVGLQVAAIPGASAVPETGDLNWNYHEEGGGYYREPEGGEEGGGGGGGPATVLVEVGSPWVCRHSDDHQCSPPWAQGGTSWCGPDYGEPGLGPNGLPWFAHARFTREVTDPANPGPWMIDTDGGLGLGTDCVEVGPEDWVSLEDIRTWVVDYSIIRDLPDPVAVISPDPQALVNLPVVVSTDYPGNIPGVDLNADPVTLTIPIDIPRPGGNLVGELRAQAKFTWTFEGRADTVNGRGHDYTADVDPRNDGGYYVKNTFTQTGDWNVHLDVLWTGEVDVEGMVSQPIPPIEFDYDATVNVVEAKPVLGRR